MQERCTVTYVGKTQPISGTFADSSLHAPSVSLSLPVYTYNLLSWAVFPLLGPPSARIFFSDCMCCLLQHYTHTDRDCGFKISPKPLDKMFNIGRSFLPQLIFYKNGDGALYLALLEKTLVEYLRIWDFTWTPNKDIKRSKDMLLFFFNLFEWEPVLHSAGRG